MIKKIFSLVALIAMFGLASIAQASVQMTNVELTNTDATLTLTPIANQVVKVGDLLAVKVTGQSRKLVPGQDVLWLEGRGGVWPVGDVSMNGEITAYDAALILQKTSQNDISPTENKLADANGDGQVNQDDIDLVGQIAVGLSAHSGEYWYLRLVSRDEVYSSTGVYLGVNGHNTSRISFVVTTRPIEDNDLPDLVVSNVSYDSASDRLVIDYCNQGGTPKLNPLGYAQTFYFRVIAEGVTVDGDDGTAFLYRVPNSGECVTTTDSNEMFRFGDAVKGKTLINVEVVADIRNIVVEKDETNNVLRLQVERSLPVRLFDDGIINMPTGSVATSKFDLYPDGPVSILQASRAKVGQPVRIRSMIRNGGKALAPVHAVRMEVRSYSDEDYRYEEVQQMPTLRRNQARYVIFTWTPPKNGNYYIDVVVDSGNVVVEKNELNNRARVGFMLGEDQMGTFALKSPEQDEKWIAGTRQRLMFDRDGVAKSSIYKLYLVDAAQNVFGPYDVVTGTNNSIGYHTPDRTLSPGEYRVVVVSCWHPEKNCVSNNKGSYWFTSMSVGLVQLMNNARVLGDSDDMDEDEVEIEDEIEIEDEAGEDDYVANEASMVRKIDDKLVNRLKGRILLQVEKRGQAWYVDPVTGDRFYLKDGAAAYTMFHRAGLGITNRDLARIPVGLNEGTDEATDTDGDGLSDLLEVAVGTNPEEADSDEDGFDDATEVRQMYNPRGKDKQSTDNVLINRLRGRILLQVEDKGQAWYLSPVDGKRYLLSDGEQAYVILRKLSLGVKDVDLQKISVGVME